MEKNDFVEINYTGRLSNGMVFDTTYEEVAENEGLDEDVDYKPKKVVVGAGHVVEGLDEDMMNAEVDEEREITVPPSKGFGEYDEDKVRGFSKREFEKKYNENPRRGMRVNVEGKPGTIISTVGGMVRVDFNHPLAGEELDYEYIIERKIEEVDEKIKALISLYAEKLEGEDFEISFDDSIIEIDVPKHASYDPSWLMLKQNLCSDIIKYTDGEKVRLVEEYTSREEGIKSEMIDENIEFDNVEEMSDEMEEVVQEVNKNEEEGEEKNKEEN